MKVSGILRAAWLIHLSSSSPRTQNDTNWVYRPDSTTRLSLFESHDPRLVEGRTWVSLPPAFGGDPIACIWQIIHEPTRRDWNPALLCNKGFYPRYSA
jgi:hypothetical protein